MAAVDARIDVRRGLPTDPNTLGVVGPAAQHLGRENARIWVAVVEGDIVGFLTMNLGVADPVSGANGGAEIARIYILGPARRLRVGPWLLAAALEEAVTEGCSYVWLHVMASADWARRAYVKWGFEEKGTTLYAGGVRVGFEEMVVMVRPITTPVA